MTKMIVPQELGSFLIEATISGALIAGLGLAGASFYKSRRQTQDYLNRLQELNAFHATLTKLLQNPANCNATFRQWALAGGAVPGTASSDIQKIWLCSSNCREEIIASSVGLPATPLMWEAMSNPSPDYLRWVPMNITNLANRQNNWQIRDIGMTPVTKTGRGVINFMYELHPGRPDAKIVKKSIIVNLKFNKANTKFISCTSDTESSVRSAMQEMCEALTSKTTGNRFASWDDNTLKCKFESGSNCGLGKGQTGIDSTGSYQCVSYCENVPAKDVFNSDSNDCSGNKMPKVITSNGQLRIVCM